MEEQGKSGRRRLVLVPSPFQGHINPTLQLGSALQSIGFSITIFHAKINAPDPSKHPDMEFQVYDAELSEFDSDGGLIQVIADLNTACKVQFTEWLVEKKNENELGNKVACIIYDALMFSAEAVAFAMKIPSIAFRTNSASYMLAYNSINWLTEEGYFPLQDSTDLQDLVPRLDPLRFRDLPFSNVSIENALKLFAMTGNIRSSSAIIWNTVEFLEESSLSKLQKQYYKVPFFPVGPLHKMSTNSSTSLLKEDDTCIDWLNKQSKSSVIYTSLGSLATMDEKELAETAWGLANSEQPFLWVIRPGSVCGSEWAELLPEGFLEKVGERGKIVKWAPQKEVLAHDAVGGFWSHCGWNSTMESIAEGVPMICWPCFLDQKVNARYVNYVWRVGLELESVLERSKIERVVKRLFVENEGDEIKKRAIGMKEKIQECLGEGGSSYNSLNDLKKLIMSIDM
jgi:hypothetical protein